MLHHAINIKISATSYMGLIWPKLKYFVKQISNICQKLGYGVIFLVTSEFFQHQLTNFTKNTDFKEIAIKSECSLKRNA